MSILPGSPCAAQMSLSGSVMLHPVRFYFDVFRNIVDRRRNHAYDGDMKNETAAKRLAELGHNTRLQIFRYLVKVGEEGVPVGQIQSKLGIPNSTLSHHLNRLISVGLIRQAREGRILYCVPQFDALRELVDFLVAECCSEGKCDL